jgi:hypothetical protein
MLNAAAGPKSPPGLIRSNGSPVVHEEALEGGLVYAVLRDGTKVLAAAGSEVVVRQAVGGSEEGERGRGTEVSVRPPAESAAGAGAQSQGGDHHVNAIELAIEKGVIPAEVAESWDYTRSHDDGEVSAQGHYSGGTYFDGGCAGAENSTGKVYGCYERYRSSQDWYTMGVRHWATADTTTPDRARCGSGCLAAR